MQYDLALGIVLYNALKDKLTGVTPLITTTRDPYVPVVPPTYVDPGLQPKNGEPKLPNGGNGLEPAGPQPTGPEYVEAFPDNTCPIGYTPERVSQQYYVCHRSDLV